MSRRVRSRRVNAPVSPGEISPQGVGSGLDADTVDGLHAASFQSIVPVAFEAAGPYVAALQVGGRRRNRSGGTWTILDVSIHREVAGSAGSTTVDVNMNGVTIYTTQTNRPTVAFGAGPDAEAQGGPPDVTVVPNNGYLSIDIDAAEVAAENLTVVVTMQVG